MLVYKDQSDRGPKGVWQAPPRVQAFWRRLCGQREKNFQGAPLTINYYGDRASSKLEFDA